MHKYVDEKGLDLNTQLFTAATPGILSHVFADYVKLFIK